MLRLGFPSIGLARTVGLVVVLGILTAGLGACVGRDETAQADVRAQLVGPPLLFEASDPDQVGASSYLARGPGYDLTVGPMGPVLALRGIEAGAGQATTVVGLRLLGASRAAPVRALEEQAGRRH